MDQALAALLDKAPGQPIGRDVVVAVDPAKLGLLRTMADQHHGGAEFGERWKQRFAWTCRRKYHAVDPMTRKNIDRLA